MLITRRAAAKTFLVGSAGLIGGLSMIPISDRRHIVTLSFDDGFEKSSIKTTEIYEKYGLSASINVIASAHEKQFELPNEYHHWPVGDFKLWNELKRRGHEIMPHSYKHVNLAELPFKEAQNLILKCLDIFTRELDGFVTKESIYNFAYNASTPELEEWIRPQVKAFRTGGGAVNPLPYKGMKKLTCASHGPENIDLYLDNTINEFLKGSSGWLIFNTHGLDDEGWGPMSSRFLDELLDRITRSDTVEMLSVSQALDVL